ncbi:MAG: O-antigen ligase family protein [Nitrospirae bacterium]|nr:O-antigen ligase family protein [Nitrospirota bacterium]
MNLLLILCAGLPLLMAQSAFFPYITGKVMYLRFSITTVAIVCLVCFMRDKLFKAQMHAKIKVLRRDPIFISLVVHFLIFTMSAFFAVNKYWAFYGSIERGEGVIGMWFFFGFFLFSALLFKMREWVWFFKLGMAASVILFTDAAIAFSNGADRPASFAGHPIYLGVFFVYVMFSSWIVYFSKEKTNWFWKIFSVALVPMCLVGILIAEARGAIVGLAAGFLFTLIYLAFRGHEIKWRGFRLRTIASSLLLLLVVSVGAFVVTRHSSLWQKIPGLDRLAKVSSKDNTTVSRLLTAKVALRAVDPREENLDKLLLGWGPENFLIAWDKYYDPDIYQYDSASLDRAHNKLLDVLVMNGIFGLISYLAIWFFAFKRIWAGRGGSRTAPTEVGQIEVQSALLFFGVSYFVQNLFVFDSVVTYTPFFAFLSFLIFYHSKAYT